jgi:TIR domain
MTAPQSTVFISYRRKVSWSIARAVFMNLHQHNYSVFMDVESIDSGRFDRIILDEIAARAHFLVILEHGTLAGCQKPDDWVRREIECAMELERNIVPILIDGFRFDDNTRAHLTGRLRELPSYNGLPLPQEYFNEAMERLRTRFLKLPAQGDITPAPHHKAPVVQHKIEQAGRQQTSAYLKRTGTSAVELPQFHTIGHVGAVDTVLFKDKVPRITLDFQEEIVPEKHNQVVFFFPKEPFSAKLSHDLP